MMMGIVAELSVRGAGLISSADASIDGHLGVGQLLLEDGGGKDEVAAVGVGPVAVAAHGVPLLHPLGVGDGAEPAHHRAGAARGGRSAATSATFGLLGRRGAGGDERAERVSPLFFVVSVLVLVLVGVFLVYRRVANFGRGRRQGRQGVEGVGRGEVPGDAGGGSFWNRASGSSTRGAGIRIRIRMLRRGRMGHTCIIGLHQLGLGADRPATALLGHRRRGLVGRSDARS
mmetsp:Transcript_23555/g.55479  ORF Transcript_23555/g.55479 Transcript_23555/m.55479 type:complete len:230 (-) Transcript_23555:234-923(-)